LFHPGLVDVVSTATNLALGVGTAGYVGSLMTLSFASSLLASPSAINYGILIGDFNSPTDRAPNGATPATTVLAEPATSALFGLGVVVLGAYRRRRRS
jgi:hypothetical protein